MAIISAQIEANGWVLRLVVSGSAGDFADYPLTPNATPKLTLSASHAGFAPSGGVAATATLVRQIVGTIPLRNSVLLSDPTARTIDETASGSNRQIRIALAETVYATDTSLSLAVLAGWRTGEGAASGISVTNNSTIVAPIPIMRWVVHHFQHDTAPVFRVSLLVFSHHPVGFAPVAGVKFTLTDGTDTITVWKTALETCPYGDDGLRCYTAEIDASTLGAGLIRADAEVYPWLGAMRSTDPAGTRVTSGLGATGVVGAVGAEEPLVLANDPAGTFYGDRWVMVDPVGGSATASTAMVGASLTLAKAVTTKARDVNTALQALWLLNKTFPAANGQSASGRTYAGAKIVLPAGVTIPGSTAVGSGSSAGGASLVIMGDPDDPNPRANCILQTPDSGSGMSGVFRCFYKDLRIELGGITLSPVSTQGNSTYLNVDVVTKTGGGAQNIVAGASTFGWQHAAVNCNWLAFGHGMSGTGKRFGLIRNCTQNFTASGYCIVKNTWTGTGDVLAAGPWDDTNFPEGSDDNILAYCDYRETRNRIYTFASRSGVVADGASYRRHAMVGNVFERIGTNPGPFIGVGESQWGSFAYNIIEANTFAGERANLIYADPSHSVVADTYTRTNTITANRVANNAFDWNPNKTDTFNSPSASALRGGSIDGYREQIGVEAWSNHMGVDREGNYDSQQSPGYASSFPHWFEGIRSASVSAAAGWTSNKSNSGDELGGGDYTPATGSPLLGRALRGQSDVDFAGNARTVGGAAGAFELVSASTPVAPASASLGLLAAAAAVLASAAPAPAAAVLGMQSAAATVSASAAVQPAGAALALQAGAAQLLPGAAVQPAGAALGLLADQAVVSIGNATTVAPAGAALGLVADSAAVSAAANIAPASAALAMIAEAASISTGPAGDDDMMPVSLAEAKAWLREDMSENDALITGLIAAAADLVERQTGEVVSGRRVVTASYRVFGLQIVLPRWPLVAVQSVQYDAINGTEATISSGAWRVREAAGRPSIIPAAGEEWPALEPTRGTVRVAAMVGYETRADVPEALRQAVLMLVANWYNNREAVVVGTISSPLPLGVSALLRPFKRTLLG